MSYNRAPVAGATYGTYSQQQNGQDLLSESSRARSLQNTRQADPEWVFNVALEGTRRSLRNVRSEFEQVQKKAGANRAYDHALLEENEPKNRFFDILPFDYNRFRLHRFDDSDVGYINASVVKHEHVNKGGEEYDFPTFHYLLTQGPLEATVNDFWRMVYESKSRVIVMLGNTVETNKLGVENEKSFQYWPDAVEMEAQYGDIVVTLRSKEFVAEGIVKRVLGMVHTPTGDAWDVTHYQAPYWLDGKVPVKGSGPNQGKEDTSLVRTLQHLLIEKHDDPVHASFPLAGETPPVGPPIIHCSSGAGRTGVFVLYDLCMRGLMSLEPEFLDDRSFINTAVAPRENLIQLRRHRLGLVSTQEQFKYVLGCIHDELTELKAKHSTLSQSQTGYDDGSSLRSASQSAAGVRDIAPGGYGQDTQGGYGQGSRGGSQQGPPAFASNGRGGARQNNYDDDGFTQVQGRNRSRQ